MSESILVISFLLEDLLKNDLISEKELMAAKDNLILQTQKESSSEDAAQGTLL